MKREGEKNNKLKRKENDCYNCKNREDRKSKEFRNKKHLMSNAREKKLSLPLVKRSYNLLNLSDHMPKMKLMTKLLDYLHNRNP